MTSIERRAVTGTMWVTLAGTLSMSVRVLQLPILARLLSPADFGIANMAIAVVIFLVSFTDLGTSNALIRDRSDSHALWNSVFWLIQLVGFSLGGLLLVTAPLIGAIYENADVIPLLQALAVILCINSLSAIPAARLARDLRFERIAVNDGLTAVISAAITIYLATIGAGPWALIFYCASTYGIRLVLYWIAAPYMPSFAFSVAELKRILPFCANLYSVQVLGAASTYADKVLIGASVGARGLGYYTQAHQLMLFPIQLVSHGAASVLFSALSRIQDDTNRLRGVYINSIHINCLILFPAFAGLAAISEPLVAEVLGRGPGWGWAPVAPLIVLMAPTGAGMAIMAFQGSLLQALGRADLLLGIAVIQVSILITSLLLGAQFGIHGIAAGLSIATLLTTLPATKVVGSQIDLRITALCRTLAPAAVAAILMGLAVWALQLWMADRGFSDLTQLLVCIPSGMVMYFSMIFAIDRRGFADILVSARDSIR